MAHNLQATAFLFPGQGSQEVGMGKALAESYSAAADCFAEADELLGFPLSRLCWEGPAEALDDTLNTQPALLTHSIAALRALQALRPGFKPMCTAGHSMGEFSALVCAGSLSFAEALKLVRARGQAMKQAGEQQPGGMAAILGAEPGAMQQACREASAMTGEPVQVANDNCPGQLVISGSERALEAAIELAKGYGAKRAVRLAVSIAAHSPLMQAAQAQFDRAVNQAAIHIPQISIIGNVSAAALEGIEAIRAELKSQLTSPVRWTESVRRMIELGVDSFIELGPKDVLTKLVGRIDTGVSALAVGGPEGIQALAA